MTYQYTETQVRELEKRAISAADAETLGILSVHDVDQLPAGCPDYWTVGNQYLPGLLFTYTSPSGAVQYQLRPDNPPEDADGRTLKYVFPKGSVPILNQLRYDPDSTVSLIVEGTCQGQVASLYAPDGVNVFGIAGCWSWTSEGTPTPDLKFVSGTETFICLDADASTNLAVYNAGASLAELATFHGATRVRHLRIPGTQKTGLDDLLSTVDRDSRSVHLARLIDEARTRTGHNPDKPSSSKPNVGSSPNQQAADEAVVLRNFVLDQYELARDENDNVIGRSRTGVNRVSLDLDTLIQRAAAVVYSGEDSIMGTYAARELGFHLGGRLDFPRATSSLRSHHDRDANTLVLDIGDDSGDVITVTPDGWTVGPNQNDRLWFRRPKKMRPIARPERGGSLADLRDMFPVSDEQWSLILGWLIASPFVEYERPLLYVFGPRGAGKTGTAVSALSLFDPPVDDDKLAPMWSDRDDPAVTVLGSMVPAFDNASALTPAQSDFLATLVTGVSVSRRTLYTTADETIISLKRTGILTGIDVKGIRPDLQERLINVQLQARSTKLVSKSAVADTRRRDGGKHLGSLLDVIVTVLAALRDGFQPPETLPWTRFADYVRVIAAFDERLALDYCRISQGDREATAMEDPTVYAIVELVRSLDGDTGKLTAANMLAKLRRFVQTSDDENVRSAYLHDSARSFGRFLSESFAEPVAGVELTRGKSNGLKTLRLSDRVVRVVSQPDPQDPLENSISTTIIAQSQIVSTDSDIDIVSYGVSGNSARNDPNDPVSYCPTCGNPGIVAAGNAECRECDEDWIVD